MPEDNLRPPRDYHTWEISRCSIAVGGICPCLPTTPPQRPTCSPVAAQQGTHEEASPRPSADRHGWLKSGTAGERPGYSRTRDGTPRAPESLAATARLGRPRAHQPGAGGHGTAAACSPPPPNARNVVSLWWRFPLSSLRQTLTGLYMQADVPPEARLVDPTIACRPLALAVDQRHKAN